jgi:hypothetical protein
LDDDGLADTAAIVGVRRDARLSFQITGGPIPALLALAPLLSAGARLHLRGE